MSSALEPVELSSSRRDDGWVPTASQTRAVVLGACGATMAVLLRRPDLLILVTPLIVLAGWSLLTRPAGDLSMELSADPRTMPEGRSARIRTRFVVPDGTEYLGVRVSCEPYLQAETARGWRSIAPDGGGRYDVDIAVRSTRWGVRQVGPVTSVAASSFASYRHGPHSLGTTRIRTLAVPAAFDSSAPSPHPRGHLGRHRSTRPGRGGEFDTIRDFQVGDRLRRIHWPTSTRTGRLHVTSTFADHDAHLLLAIDASSDLGTSGGIDGEESGLDMAVRACAAIAAHALAGGDRVSVHATGATRFPRLPPGTGTRHLRRIVEALSTLEPASDRTDAARPLLGAERISMAVVLSPMISDAMPATIGTLAGRGVPVVVVDTFPRHLTTSAQSPQIALAWRLRLALREELLRAVAASGTPVVTWRGPGSLDAVLRDMARQARAPRMVRR